MNKKRKEIEAEIESVKLDKRKIDAELDENKADIIRKEESIKTLRKQNHLLKILTLINLQINAMIYSQSLIYFIAKLGQLKI